MSFNSKNSFSRGSYNRRKPYKQNPDDVTSVHMKPYYMKLYQENKKQKERKNYKHLKRKKWE